mgnify:CR=1 FL=1
MFISNNTQDYYNPGRSGSVNLKSLNGPQLAFFGEIHPAIIKNLDCKDKNIFGFEIFLKNIPEPNKKLRQSKKSFQASDYQKSERDFAFVIDKIFKIGGIQAIAAMTFGTESIPKVYKIFGPGNQYVTSAKQFATRYSVSIDMPAGPSELLVAADETADPDFVASDLLSQAEHGPDSQVVLVSTKKDFVEKVNKSISYQIDELQRNDIVKKALLNSKAIIFDNDKSAVDFINEYSPEHYIICVKNEDYYIKNVKNEDTTTDATRRDTTRHDATRRDRRDDYFDYFVKGFP